MKSIRGGREIWFSESLQSLYQIPNSEVTGPLMNSFWFHFATQLINFTHTLPLEFDLALSPARLMVFDKLISAADDRHENFTQVIESGIPPDQSFHFQSQLTTQTDNRPSIVIASSTQLNSRQLEISL